MQKVRVTITDGDDKLIKVVDDLLENKRLGGVRGRCYFHAFTQPWFEHCRLLRTYGGTQAEVEADLAFFQQACRAVFGVACRAESKQEALGALKEIVENMRKKCRATSVLNSFCDLIGSTVMQNPQLWCKLLLGLASQGNTTTSRVESYHAIGKRDNRVHSRAVLGETAAAIARTDKAGPQAALAASSKPGGGDSLRMLPSK